MDCVSRGDALEAEEGRRRGAERERGTGSYCRSYIQSVTAVTHDTYDSSFENRPLIGGSIPYSASMPIGHVTNPQNQIISAQFVESLIGQLEIILSCRASGFALQPIFGSVFFSGCGVITMLLLAMPASTDACR